MLKLSLSIVFLGFFLTLYPNNSFNKAKELNCVIECRKVPVHGLYSFLMQMVEWIYCVKQEKHLGLYVNMSGAYGFNGDTFSMLFKPFEDEQITTIRPNISPILYIAGFPGNSGLLRTYVTSGFKNFEESNYVYKNVAFYTDPDFSIFRERLHPIVSQFLQPVAELQNKIDALLKKMSQPSKEIEMNVQNILLKPPYKIGIHVRCMEHYPKYEKSSTEFLDDIEKDIDEMMKLHDPHNTCIYLATMLEPIVKRLSVKYRVVVCDMQRIPDVKGDWLDLPHAQSLDTANTAIIDTWCLANCDELWGSSSNMTIFAGCLNPHLKIRLIPSLAHYDGT